MKKLPSSFPVGLRLHFSSLEQGVSLQNISAVKTASRNTSRKNVKAGLVIQLSGFDP